MDGEAILILDSKERRIGPGDAAIVPPDARHAVKVLGSCRAIIVDYPIRLDLPGVRRPQASQSDKER